MSVYEQQYSSKAAISSPSCLNSVSPPSHSLLLYLQHWCTRWCLETWQPSSSGCTRAGPSTTPEPKTSRISSVSIICLKASSSECSSTSRRPGRSTTASTVTRYTIPTNTSSWCQHLPFFTVNLYIWHLVTQHVWINNCHCHILLTLHKLATFQLLIRWDSG